MSAYLPSPGPVLGLVVASLYTAIFFLLWGRRPLELVLLWPAALLGFTLGHLAGALLDTRWLVIGVVHVVEGSLGAWLFLGLTRRIRLPA